MKKYSKRLLLLFLMIIMIFLVSGCGGEVETHSEMKIGENGSGSRMIYAEFSKTSLRSKSGLSLNKVDKLINANCPKELTWKRTAVGNDYRYTFTLKFSDLEDYEKKVKSILGNDGKVEIMASDSLYEEGFSIKEGFISSDLLGWLKKAIKKEEKVSDSSLEELFKEVESTLTYNGKKINAGTKGISYDNTRAAKFEQIQLMTEITPEKQMNRTIRFKIQMDVSDEKQEEIREHLQNILPQGAESNWEEEEDFSVYQITMQNLSPDQMISMMQTVMESKKPAWSEKSSNDGKFRFSEECVETVDLSSYLVGKQENIELEYYIKDQSGATVKGGEGKKEGSGDQEKAQTDIPEGYEKIYEGKTDSVQISFSIDNIYTISEIHVSTDVGWKDKFKRNVVLYYDRVPQQAEQEIMIATLQKAANGTSDITVQPKGGTFAISVSHSGNAQKMTQAFARTFGCDSTIGYRQDYSGLFRFSMPYIFEEEVRFDKFLSQTTQPAIYYHTNFLNGETVSKKDMENGSGTASADGTGYEDMAMASTFHATVITTQKSYLPIFLLVILAVVVVTVIVIIIKIVRDKKEKKTEKTDVWLEEEKAVYQKRVEKEPQLAPLDKAGEEKADEWQKKVQESLAEEITRVFAEKPKETSNKDQLEKKESQTEKQTGSQWAKPKEK